MRDCRTTLLATVNAELVIWSVESGKAITSEDGVESGMICE